MLKLSNLDRMYSEKLKGWVFLGPEDKFQNWDRGPRLGKNKHPRFRGGAPVGPVGVHSFSFFRVRSQDLPKGTVLLRVPRKLWITDKTFEAFLSKPLDKYVLCKDLEHTSENARLYT